MTFEHVAGHEINGGDIVVINGMNMRWIMLTLQEIHADDNAVESGQYWHGINSFSQMHHEIVSMMGAGKRRILPIQYYHVIVIL